jgi:hypothetical protein
LLPRQFVHDELNGSDKSVGFLTMCMVFAGDITLSVDGTQDNTQSLAGGTVHLVYDTQCLQSLQTDNSLPVAILAILTTHTISSVKDFPLVSELLGSARMKEQLEAGECAGSLESIDRRVREETDVGKGHFRHHLGDFLSRAAHACLTFMDNKQLEESSRAGVALWERAPLLRRDVLAAPDPSIVRLSGPDGMTPHFQLCSLDNRLQRGRPKPRDFSCEHRLLAPGDPASSARAVGAEELARLGSYPLLHIVNECSGMTVAPPIARECSASAVLSALEAERRAKDAAQNAASAVKDDEKQRPKLPLPVNAECDEALSPIGVSLIQRMERSMVDYRVQLEQAKREARDLVFKGGQRSAAELYDRCAVALESTKQQVQEGNCRDRSAC